MRLKGNVKLLLIGKSGSGKDTIAERLNAHGLTQLLSYTTRPQRESEIDNPKHKLVDKCTASQEEMLAYAKLYDNEYWATYKDLDESVVYVIDPKCAVQVKESYTEYCNKHNIPDTKVLIVAIDTDDSLLANRMKQRGDTPDSIQKRLDTDRDFHSKNLEIADLIVKNNGFIADSVESILNYLIENDLAEPISMEDEIFYRFYHQKSVLGISDSTVTDYLNKLKNTPTIAAMRPKEQYEALCLSMLWLFDNVRSEQALGRSPYEFEIDSVIDYCSNNIQDIASKIALGRQEDYIWIADIYTEAENLYNKIFTYAKETYVTSKFNRNHLEESNEYLGKILELRDRYIFSTNYKPYQNKDIIVQKLNALVTYSIQDIGIVQGMNVSGSLYFETFKIDLDQLIYHTSSRYYDTCNF